MAIVYPSYWTSLTNKGIYSKKIIYIVYSKKIIVYCYYVGNPKQPGQAHLTL